jgi:hypothetical protein
MLFDTRAWRRYELFVTLQRTGRRMYPSSRRVSIRKDSKGQLIDDPGGQVEARRKSRKRDDSIPQKD